MDGKCRLFFEMGRIASSSRRTIAASQPHVHVRTESKLAKFWLDPVSLADSGRYSRTELNQIAAIVARHREASWSGGMSSSVAEVREARATGVRVDEESLTIDLVDGRTMVVPLIWFPRLWHGTPREWEQVEIFGDGVALHWPDLDEDLSVPDLIAGRPSGESPGSLRGWLASRRKAGKPVRA